MSEMKTDVDLGALARSRGNGDDPTRTIARPRRRALRWLVPFVLLAGFAAVLLSTLGHLFRGVSHVTVIRPQPASGASAPAGSSLLQRSGWVEPDPFAVQATALTSGVVREMLVLEGDVVTAGQPLARLVDEKAKLDLERADAALAKAKADASRAAVERDVAQASFDAALEVTEAEATAKAALAGRTAESERRAAAAKEAAAKVRVAEEELALAKYLAENGGAGPRQVELAQAKLEAEQAGLDSMKADAALASAEVEKAKARLVRATRERELRLADRLRRDGAVAAAQLADAAVKEAESMRASASLELDRMVVKAPVAGVVLQRLAAPGTMVGVESREAVATLYDPSSLRVRVDVEQSEVAKVAVGQSVQVKSPMRPEKLYDGDVIRVVRLANVEKVTLQVHVKVREPDAALRPEMLVEARFLAKSAGERTSGDAEPAAAGLAPGAVWIPSRLLVERDGSASVWLVDALTGRAALRKVDVAQREGDRALVRSGLNVSDKLIDEGREQLRGDDALMVHEMGGEGGGR
jgi:HlyD family secretion protein